jgi:hypothetical protein
LLGSANVSQIQVGIMIQNYKNVLRFSINLSILFSSIAFPTRKGAWRCLCSNFESN